MVEPKIYPHVGFIGSTEYIHPNHFKVNLRWLYHNFCRQYLHWDGVTRVWRPPYGYKNIIAYPSLKEKKFDTKPQSSKIKSVVELENKETVLITAKNQPDRHKFDPEYLTIYCGLDQEILFEDGFFSPRIILEDYRKYKNGLGQLVIPVGYYTRKTTVELVSIEEVGARNLYSLELVRNIAYKLGPFIVRPHKYISPSEPVF